MYNMTIRLQAESELCLYEQIYEHVRKEIREGRLPAGERLPSTRSLAENLQVARSTVDTAYAQLQGEGYIESRVGSGYYVCRIDELFSMDHTGRESEEHSTAYPAEREKGKKRAAEASLIDFSPGATDMSRFPFGVWKKITKQVLSEENRTLFASGDGQGEWGLRRAICDYLYASRGVKADPSRVVVGAGNDYLLLLLEKILGKNVRFAMEEYSYKRAYRIVSSFGYEVCAIGMDESGIRVDELYASGARAVYCMPSHQYPTGVVMPIGRRLELLRWADEGEGRYLIEDDYDSEFRYRGKPIPALQASDSHGRVIYMGTFSKAIAPSMRMSYMVLPERLMEQYDKNCGFYSSTVSRMDQQIFRVFLEEGYFERHLNKMRKLYRLKHDTLLECLEPLLKDFILSGENAGLHLLLTDRRGRSEEALIEESGRAGVGVYGIRASALGENAAGEISSPAVAGRKKATIILGYGGLTQEQIRKGCSLLENAWL